MSGLSPHLPVSVSSLLVIWLHAQTLEVSLNILFLPVPNIQATIKSFDLIPKISWDLYTFFLSTGLH